MRTVKDALTSTTNEVCVTGVKTHATFTRPVRQLSKNMGGSEGGRLTTVKATHTSSVRQR